MNILLKNAYIITLDDEKIIENGYLGTNGKKISYIGDKLPDESKYDYVLDLKGKTVMPSFSNAHCHTAMTILRSYSEGYPLQRWLNEKIFPIEDKLSGNEIYWGTMLGIAELLKFGTTLVNDCYYFMEDAVRAYRETGMSANVSRCVMNFEEKDDYSSDYRMKECIELYKNYNGIDDDLIRVEMFPHAVYTCSYNYLKYTAEISQKYNMPITSHLSENAQEVSDCIKKYGKTPVEIYEETGLLSDTTLMAHCVHLNDNDIKLLKGHYVAHNPKSNLKLGSGICDIYKYQQNGINIAIGTDGASSNNNLNMLSELNYAALLMCNKNSDPSYVSPYEILKMATLNGAKAMRRENKGMLKEGYDADFIILNTDEIYHLPNHNVINNIVYASCGTEVETTVSGGKILYHKGEYKTIDIERLKSEILKIKEKIF